MALTSGCKASGSQERKAERRKLGSSCHALASSLPLPTFFEANSRKINSVRFCTLKIQDLEQKCRTILTCRLDQDLTMMRGFESRLVENFANSGATTPSRMNLRPGRKACQMILHQGKVKTGIAEDGTNLPNHLYLSAPSTISCSVGGSVQA